MFGLHVAGELCEVYTKSTMLVEDVDVLGEHTHVSSSGGGSVYLMCISESSAEGGGGGADAKVRIGMVCIDTASGDIVYDEWEDGELRQNLASRVAHLQPRELLLPKGLSSTTSKLLKRLVAPLALSQATAVRSDRLVVAHRVHSDCQLRHNPPREALGPAQSREEHSTEQAGIVDSEGRNSRQCVETELIVQGGGDAATSFRARLCPKQDP